MRIRFNKDNIVECYKVNATKGGMPDKNDPWRYSEMSCYLLMHSLDWPGYRDDDYDEEFDCNIVGEFDHNLELRRDA